MSQKVLLVNFKTAFNKVEAHITCHFTQKNDRNRLHGEVTTSIRLNEVRVLSVLETLGITTYILHKKNVHIPKSGRVFLFISLRSVHDYDVK